MARDFKKIKAWQHADKLVMLIYEKTKLFPEKELYGITSQLRRAAVSVPTNIAEGANRKYKKEYRHFLYIADASASEVEYLLYLAHNLGYLASNDYTKLENLREETVKTLPGLIKVVEKETQSK